MNAINGKAKPKAHSKHCQKTLNTWRLHKRKIPMQEFWGLKKGEGICPKGVHFQELTACACEREKGWHERDDRCVWCCSDTHRFTGSLCVCERGRRGGMGTHRFTGTVNSRKYTFLFAHTYMHTHKHIHTHTYTHSHIHTHTYTCILDPLIQTWLRELPVAVELISCQNANLFKDDVNMIDRWTIGQR